MSNQKSLGTDLCHPKRVMLFDLEHGGHHANYIRHLIRYWSDRALPIDLYIVVSPQFVEKHHDVVQSADQHPRASIEFIPVSEQEKRSTEVNKQVFSKLFSRLKEWQILCQYAAKLQIDHCLILYLDTSEIPLTLGLRPPCLISGIYFRPTFHYKKFAGHRHASKSWPQQLRERLFIHRMLHNPYMHTLFCLGPFADEAIRQIYPEAKAIALADPVEIPQLDSSDSQGLLDRHEISPERKVFLLFGAITTRKGIYQLLEALEGLPSALCQQVCILVVGDVDTSEKSSLCAQIDRVCKAQPVQIATRFEFVSESEMQRYFHLTDFVLALYQQHVGMSGILLLAAAAQRPVLSSDYGLMGELVRRYQLGIDIDAGSPAAIAAGITQLLSADKSFYNLEKMKRFVEENSAVRFAQTIFENV